jgi:hypothetical protein|tara:strand:+ start:434 stop:679 length:246 start_codon:yes stop_codon:yes gene_type:complete
VSTAEIETLHSKIGQLVVAWDFLADALAQWLNGSIPRSARQKMVRKDHKLSVRRQCALQAVARSKPYYQPKGESAEKGGLV